MAWTAMNKINTYPYRRAVDRSAARRSAAALFSISSVLWEGKEEVEGNKSDSAIASTMMAENSVKVIPFCVTLPPILSPDPSLGVVGTVTLRGKSAVVWFGWGAVEPCDGGEEQAASAAVGCGRPAMGPLALAMPPAVRSGGRRDAAAPTTQLVAGPGEEDMILSQQISSRISRRTDWPVFVSCSVAGRGGGMGEGGLESPAMGAGMDDSLPSHAAALAEKEVSRIILREKESALESNAKSC